MIVQSEKQGRQEVLLPLEGPGLTPGAGTQAVASLLLSPPPQRTVYPPGAQPGQLSFTLTPEQAAELELWVYMQGLASHLEGARERGLKRAPTLPTGDRKWGEHGFGVVSLRRIPVASGLTSGRCQT